MILPAKTIALGFFLCSFAPSVAQAQTRIATVNLQKVFNNYWKKKEAEKGLNAQAMDLEKEIRPLVENHKRAKDEAQSLLAGANDQAVSPEERERRRTAAEERLKQVKELEDNLVQYDRQARATLDGQGQTIRTKLFKEITDIINAKAKAGGFTLVLNNAAQTEPTAGFVSLPLVLYADSKDDLTEAVLSDLNATAPPPASAADSSSDVVPPPTAPTSTKAPGIPLR